MVPDNSVPKRALLPLAVLLCSFASAQSSIETIATLNGHSGRVSSVSSDGSVAVLSVSNPSNTGYSGVLWSESAGGVVNLTSTSAVFSSAEVNYCSADGSIAVGSGSTLVGTRAFRWTLATGMQDLGVLTGASHSFASSISADGSTIIGTSGMPVMHGFVWTSSGGMQDLGAGVLPSSCSNDGNVVVGVMDVAGQQNLFRWTQATGVQTLGFTPGMPLMGHPKISANGSAIVGASTGSTGIPSQPYRWTAQSGLQDLPSFPGGMANYGEVSGISADGSVITGSALNHNSDYRAFRWTAATGIQDLGGLGQTSGERTSSYACSSDGSTFVGLARASVGAGSYPVRWTALNALEVIDTLQPASPGPGSISLLDWVNADGTIVLGVTIESGTAELKFFRWEAGSTGIGSNYSQQTTPNSTGSLGTIAAAGSRKLADNDLTLTAANLPQNSFGIFVVGSTYAETPVFGGGNGTLLVGGHFGRFNRSNEIQYSGLSGSFDLQVDLSSTTSAFRPLPVRPGQTWYFQAWHRDLTPAGPTSNLTNAVAITFF